MPDGRREHSRYDAKLSGVALRALAELVLSPDFSARVAAAARPTERVAATLAGAREARSRATSERLFEAGVDIMIALQNGAVDRWALPGSRTARDAALRRLRVAGLVEVCYGGEARLTLAGSRHDADEIERALDAEGGTLPPMAADASAIEHAAEIEAREAVRIVSWLTRQSVAPRTVGVLVESLQTPAPYAARTAALWLMRAGLLECDVKCGARLVGECTVDEAHAAVLTIAREARSPSAIAKREARATDSEANARVAAEAEARTREAEALIPGLLAEYSRTRGELHTACGVGVRATDRALRRLQDEGAIRLRSGRFTLAKCRLGVADIALRK